MSVGFTASQIGGDAPASAPAAAPAAPAAPVAPSPMVAPSAPVTAAENASAQIPADAVEDVSGEPQTLAESLEAPDPWQEKVLGERTAKEVLDKLKESDGLIPEDLLDLEHEYVYGEGEDAERQRMTLREALDLGHKERMQLREFHRELHKVRSFEQQVVARGRAIEAAVKGLNNPDTMVEDLFGLGVEEQALDAAIIRYARQKNAYKNASPEQRAWLDQQKMQRQQMLQLQREVAELRSVKQQSEDAQFKQGAQSVLRTHMPKAFEKHGLNAQSEYAREKFQFFLERACGGKPPTREHIFAAALAARQDIDVMQREERQAAAKARPSGGKPLGPSRGAAPASLKVPAQANGRKRGYTTSELENLQRG